MKNPFQLNIVIPRPSLSRKSSSRSRKGEGSSSSAPSSPSEFGVHAGSSLLSIANLQLQDNSRTATPMPRSSLSNSYFPEESTSSLGSTSSTASSSSRSSTASPSLPMTPTMSNCPTGPEIEFGCSTPPLVVATPKIAIQPLAVTVGPTQLRSAIRMAKEAREGSGRSGGVGDNTTSTSKGSSKRRPSTAPLRSASDSNVASPAPAPGLGHGSTIAGDRRSSLKERSSRMLHTVVEDGEVW